MSDQPICTSFREGQFGDHCVTCGVNYPIHPHPAAEREHWCSFCGWDADPPCPACPHYTASRQVAAYRPGGAE